MIASSPKDLPPTVTVVIPNFNGADWVEACLEALTQQTFPDFEVILVDNGSTDDSKELARKTFAELKLIALDSNYGFATAANKGIRLARGRYVALLNSDTVVRPEWLGALIRTLDQSPPDVGAVASKILSMDDPGLTDDAGDRLCWTGAAEKVGHGQPADLFTERREIFSPSAGATLYRKSFLEALGGFDEAFFAYLEDVDLGLRGRLRGYRYLFEPAAEVLHKGHGSQMPKSTYVRLMTRNRLMLFLKNIPAVLLFKHLSQLTYGQMYYFIVYRRPAASLSGYFAFLKCLPHTLRERRRITHQLTNESLDELVSVETSEPSLRQLLAQRWKRVHS